MIFKSKNKFHQFVKEEIQHLRENATTKELERLDFKKFIPCNRLLCIYGLLTGDSCSKRAIELRQKTLALVDTLFKTYHEIEKQIRLGNTFTPLEVYLMLNNSRNKEVFEYLHGKIKIISL